MRARIAIVFQRPAIAIVVALAAASPSTATADPKGLVTDALSAQLDPIGKLAAPEREKQVCASGDALLKLAMAISPKQVPKGVPLDESTWRGYVGDVQATLDAIVELCKLPGHQRKSIGNDLETASAEIESLFKVLPALVDVARPRTLSPALAKARRSIDTASWESKSFCTQSKTIVKQLAAVPRPEHADAARWDAQLGEVTSRAQEMRDSACSKQKLAPEELGGLPVGVSEAFYKLVVLVPPS